ncbi:DNAJ protein [Spraguea lophii 42_110]|uniref:DNAJ protein n=1 Tax=Spraguea lophii (strain 42_110) TaxID=1358809 RepID=S7W6R1_SPRLO|nr:DNAJ protein [Spraguea lophii 42_110]
MENTAEKYISQGDYQGYYNFAKRNHNNKNTEESEKEMKKAEKLFNKYKKIEEYIKIDKNDYYKILNVDRNSSTEEIDNAYKKLAIQFHPDKTRIKESNEVFTKIKNAHEVLKSKDRRRTYDQQENRNGYTFTATEYSDIINEYIRRREQEEFANSFLYDPFINQFYNTHNILYPNLYRQYTTNRRNPRYREIERSSQTFIFSIVLIIFIIFLFN